MNFPNFILVLVVASTSRSSADNYGDGAEISSVKSSLRRRYAPDQYLQLIAMKKSKRDDSIPTTNSSGNWETDETFDQDERDLGTACGTNEKYFKLVLQTDDYGFETSWILVKKQSNSLVKIASGPPSGTNYRDDNVYVGGYCLSAGNYKFTIKDKFKDGMNGGNGGSYTGYVAGTKKFGSPSEESEWGQRVHEFSVTTSSGNSIIPTDPDIAKIDTTDTDEKWLHAHNKRRKEWHTRYGKSYVPLQWSNALKAQSKAYAQDLLSTCGTPPVHDLNTANGSTSYGENLDSNHGTGSWAKQCEPETVLTRFVEREVGDEWPHNAHLTQVLWRATKYVGCDVASKEFEGGMCHRYVCRYARAGNCNMGAYQSNQGDQRWLEPMLNEDRLCGPECPPDGC